jgi:hypothetical protein
VTSKTSKPKPKTTGSEPQPPSTSGDPSGGVSPIARAAAAGAVRVEGTIAPARPGRWLTVQRKVGTRWATAVDAHVGRGGRYSVAVPAPGIYRVVYGKAVGPDVRVG